MTRFSRTKEKPPKHDRKVAYVAIAAAVVGAGLTALFTPKSGKDTRKAISDGAKTVEHKGENLAKSVKNTVTPAKKNAKTTAKRAASQTTKAASTSKRAPAKSTRTTKTVAKRTAKAAK